MFYIYHALIPATIKVFQVTRDHGIHPIVGPSSQDKPMQTQYLTKARSDQLYTGTREIFVLLQYYYN